MSMLNYAKSNSALNLYLVTDPVMCETKGLVHTVIEAINGGVSFVQLRDKYADDDSLLRMANELKEAIDGRVPLIINDRVDIAKKAKLDGAHIGQDDLNVEEARELLGPEAWLGLTINTLQQLEYAQTHYLSLIDYFGFGPVFTTRTKTNHAEPLAITGLTSLVSASRLPSVAIGGINLSNATEVYKTGCDGIAVVSAICASAEPKKAAHQLFLSQSGVQ